MATAETPVLCARCCPHQNPPSTLDHVVKWVRTAGLASSTDPVAGQEAKRIKLRR